MTEFVAPVPAEWYRLPRAGSVLSYGYRRYRRPDGTWHHHQGIDIPAPQGTPLLAVGAGEVVFVHGGDGPARGYDGYGRVVVLRLTAGLWALYGHCEKTSVAMGQIVLAGEPVGEVGGTAFRRAAPAHRCGAHLHFELAETKYPKPLDRRAGDWGRVDPSEWLKSHVISGNGKKER